VFIIAYSNKIRRRFGRNRMSDAPRSEHWKATQDKCGWQDVECWLRETFQGSYGTATASELKRVDEWFPERLDRCDSLGNAVVPQVAEFVGRRIIEATEI
jgi:site-specific DNA-cytosine methylase